MSASGQKWDSADSIFLREIMEAFADESVNELSCMCSAQSAKTLTMLCLLAWAIAEDPGPILWVTSSVQEAR
ncbi:MAG: phage terminase large subunit family protein, partial [Verrucomicrobiia bacterium]